MRTKLIQLGIVLAAGFLAGGMVANMSALADDDEEESELPVSMVYKVIEDGECAAPDPPFPEPFSFFDPETYGWCPDGQKSLFDVEVSGITEESAVIARVVGGEVSGSIFTNTRTPANVLVNVGGTERDVVHLVPGVSPADSSDLRLIIINPPEE